MSLVTRVFYIIIIGVQFSTCPLPDEQVKSKIQVNLSGVIMVQRRKKKPSHIKLLLKHHGFEVKEILFCFVFCVGFVLEVLIFLCVDELGTFSQTVLLSIKD